MARSDQRKERDPRKKKARDLARQRKIASNGSDKAARRHARTIKAMANRKIRRLDKQALTDGDTIVETADQISHAHKHKDRHWGTDNAAERRNSRRAALAAYQEAGGRKELQSRRWQEIKDLTHDANVIAVINAALDRLYRKKKKH